MKSIVLTSIVVLLFSGLNAQVTLDKKYDYSTSTVKLETQGYKYFLMDVPNAQCRIYNLDHSIFKTINCSVPGNFYLSDIKYISEGLFDNDAGIELAYTYYKYNSAGEYYEYNSKVINEDGSVLASMVGAQYLYVKKTEENTFKLFAYCFDYSVFPEKVWTNIYSLQGILTSSVVENNIPELNLSAFPNPASQKVNIMYHLPENFPEGVLHLLDNSGRLVKQFSIDKHTDHLALDITSFESGLYHYFVAYGNTKSESKKLVISEF